MTLPVIFSSVLSIGLQILINLFWRILSWSIDKASDISNKIVIVSDLNVDFLNIPHTHPVNEILTSQFSENKISESPRVTQSTSTLIDPILAIYEVLVFDSGTLGVDQNISDHLCTNVLVKTNVCNNGA